MNDEISYEKGAQVLFSKLYTSHSIIVQRKKSNNLFRSAC